MDRPSLKRLGAALIAACGVMLAAPLSVDAASSRPDFARVPEQPGLGRLGFGFRRSLGPGPLALAPFARHGTRPDFVKRRGLRRRPFFAPFLRHGMRPDFVKRRRHRRRPIVAPFGFYYAPAYAYGYRPAAAPSYPSQAGGPAPAREPPPVTPKWVHVGGIEGASGPGGGTAGGDGLGQNCLTVKMQITVDGAPVDAFGTACLLADGSWQLHPSEQTD